MARETRFRRRAGSLEDRVRRFVTGKPARSERERHTSARKAEELLVEIETSFQTGEHRLEDVLARFRHLQGERLAKVAKDADQLLPEAREQAGHAEDMAEVYRRTHGLEEIKADEAPNQVFVCGVLAALVCVEIMPTTALMAHGSDLLTGFGRALLPAAWTLIVAFLGSLAIRRSQAKTLWDRVSGTALAGLAIVAGIGGHFVAAHYREAPSISFVLRATATPFDLSSTSLWVFLLGVVCFFLILHEMRRLQHPVFLYGKRLRAWAEAEKEVRSNVIFVQNRIEAEIDRTRDEAEQLVQYSRQQAGNGVVVAEEALRRLGVADPAAWEAGETPDPVIAGLVDQWKRFRLRRQSWMDLGDIRVRLAQREGAGPEDPPVVVEELSDAVTLGEGLDWVSRFMDRLEGQRPEEGGAEDVLVDPLVPVGA